jgi:hypothetical protein
MKNFESDYALMLHSVACIVIETFYTFLSPFQIIKKPGFICKVEQPAQGPQIGFPSME